MATIVNSRDKILQAATVRVEPVSLSPNVSVTTGQVSGLAPIINNATLAEFSPFKSWNFNTDAEAWTVAGTGSLVATGETITLSSTGTDPVLESPGSLAMSGKRFDKVRIRFRRTAGDGWDGLVSFTTASGLGEDITRVSVQAAPNVALNAWTVMEWDMSTVPTWVANTINSFRIDLGSKATDVFEIDWIAVGRYATGSDELTAAAAAAGTTATWAGVSGTGKPDDNATFTSPSKGSALNDDPAIENLNAWTVGDTVTKQTTNRTDAVAKNFFNCTSGTDKYTSQKRFFSVDRSRTYNLTAMLYAAPTNDRNMYIWVNFYDMAGNLLHPSPDWGGSKSGYTFGGLPPANVWSRQGGNFGNGVPNCPIPVGTVAAEVGVWFQYSGGGTTAVQQGMQDLRCVDVSDSFNLSLQLIAISSDDVLSKGEKSEIMRQWDTIYNEQAGIYNQAFSLGITTERDTFYTAVNNLSSYLGGLSPAYNNVTQDTPIVGATFRTNFSNYYKAKQALLTAMDAKAALTATWTSVSGTGKPADNASSDLVLVGRGATVVGNTATKTATLLAWNSDIYSVDSFTGGAYASAVATDATSFIMFGLNTDPLTSSSYDSIDYAVYLSGAGTGGGVRVYESGSPAPGTDNFGAYVAGDVFAVIYDGSSVKYLKNGSVFFTSARADSKVAGQKLFFDSSIYTTGAVLKNIRFGPMSSNNWSSVGGTGKPADNATVGATLGTNVSGQITPTNSAALIASQAISSVQISDLRTTNYAEDASGNPTAGGKLSSTGTAMKVANNSFQVGSLVFSDYWYRLIQGIDGNIANGRVIWRGNNDATVRGGAPNIDCLSIMTRAVTATGKSEVTQGSNGYSFVHLTGNASFHHNFKLTPTSYGSATDNLDAMQQIHVQMFSFATDKSPFIEFYETCPSRTYDGATGSVQGNMSVSFAYACDAWESDSPPVGGQDPKFSGTAGAPVHSKPPGNNSTRGYYGYLRIRIGNTYGWSNWQDYGPADAGILNPRTTITGCIPSLWTGGSGTQGGACPAPWVKVRLLNGKEVNAGDLHNGACVAAVNDTTLEVAPKGGIVRDLAVIWKQRYRVKLEDGSCTEWSENHRFAVAERGWVNVEHLRGGDHIVGLKESIVSSVLAVGEGQVVSFRVEGAGTYFAGGLLCHNVKTI